ncbi:PAS domain-containing protein [Roseateles chitinivorans]|uniref:PAS domain-containing protein n=1 Tax=Roseateles chitinivorans TaxID=2917965 RepID=UPI003D66F201
MTTPPLPQQPVAHVSNEAKEANEALLNLAVEVADIGLWDLDLVTDRLEFSPCMRRMFGLTPHEPITRERFRAMLHPDDRERVMQAVASAQDSHRRPAYEVEYRVVSASAGDVRWVAAKAGASSTLQAVACASWAPRWTSRNAGTRRSSNTRPPSG